MNSEWKEGDARHKYQTADEQTESQPDCMTDRGKRLNAPNSFEGQYAQRRKRVRQDRQSENDLQEGIRARQKPDKFPRRSRQPDRPQIAVRHNQTMSAQLIDRQQPDRRSVQISEGQQNGTKMQEPHRTES